MDECELTIMDRVKIKNLIIAILIVVNLFLLGLVIANSRRQQDATQLRTEALTAILEKNGITLAEDVEFPSAGGRIVELERSLSGEKRMLSWLIGSCTYADQGGGIFVFTGSDGTASISGTGEIRLTLYSGGSYAGDDIEAEAKAILNKLNIEYDSGSAIQSEADGLDCVTFTCLYKGSAVLNAKISLFFSEGKFAFLQGRRPPDRAVGSEPANKELDAVAVIMSFLESIRRTGDVCSSVTDVSTAYVLDSAGVGSNTLTPVWCIETDTGVYYFDGVTGKSRTPET